MSDRWTDATNEWQADVAHFRARLAAAERMAEAVDLCCGTPEHAHFIPMKLPPLRAALAAFRGTA